jgi:hypothetical protein
MSAVTFWLNSSLVMKVDCAPVPPVGDEETTSLVDGPPRSLIDIMLVCTVIANSACP